MRILIATHGKTGSTALAYLLQNNLPGHEMAFEPATLDAVPESPNLINKYFIKGNDFCHPKVATYDRVILLVRHPFDTLVSHAMYMPFAGGGFFDDENVQNYLDLIERKIVQPSAVPFRDVLEYCNRQLGFDEKSFNRFSVVTRFAEEQRDRIFVLKYEDLVDRKIDALSAYLGMTLRDAVEVPDKLARVRRTFAYGDWINWYTDEDVEYYSGIRQIQRYLAYFAYEHTRDGLPPGKIDPEYSTRYIVRIINEARGRVWLTPFEPGKLLLRDPGGYLGRGLTAFRRNQNPAALKELQAAEAGGLRLPAIYFVRGMAHRREARHGHAARAFSLAAELQPDNLELLMALAQSYLAAGKPEEAREVAARALELDPAHVPAFMVESRACNKLGLKAEASEAARKALELSAGNEKISSYVQRLSASERK